MPIPTLPPDPTSNQPAGIARPTLPVPQRWLLGLAGALILGVAAALLFAADTPGPTTTVTEPATTTVATTIEATRTKAVTTPAPTSPAPPTTMGTSAVAPPSSTTVATEAKPTATKAVTTPSMTKVTTTPGHAAQASDTLVVLLVGFGLVLLISGISGRITKITLPGGAGFGFDEPAEQKIRDVVKEKAGDDPVVVETLSQGAIVQLTPQYGGFRGPPPEDAIKEAVENAAKAVQTTADKLEDSPAS
jgi:hypothetical protein